MTSTAIPAAEVPLRNPRVPGTVARYLICLLVVGDAAQVAMQALTSRWAQDFLIAQRGLLYLIAGVFFLVWVRRCHLNAETLAPGAMRHGPDWAVLMWLLPPIQWWAPRRQLLDVWRATGATPDARLVNAWWAAWLGNLAFAAGSTIYASASHHDPSAAVAVVNAILYAAAGVLVVILIGRITTAHTAKLRQLPEHDRPA